MTVDTSRERVEGAAFLAGIASDMSLDDLRRLFVETAQLATALLAERDAARLEVSIYQRIERGVIERVDRAYRAGAEAMRERAIAKLRVHAKQAHERASYIRRELSASQTEEAADLNQRGWKFDLAAQIVAALPLPEPEAPR
jgi:hypothetical protein